MNMKTCTKCERELPADLIHFHKHKSCKFGLRSVCKECRGTDFGIKNPNKVLGRRDGHKICSNCRNELPLEPKFFHRHSSSYDGYGSKCKKCLGSDYEVFQPNKVVEVAKGYKTCSICRNVFPYTSFSNMKDNKDGYNSRCRKCDRKVALEYMSKPGVKEKKKSYAKEYRLKYYKTDKGIKVNVLNCQRRRSRKQKAKIDYGMNVWDETLVLFDNKCAYCGKSGKLHQEHIIPLSKGGGYIKENIIPACYKCNGSKHDRVLEEWYPKQPFYDMKRMYKIKLWTKGEVLL